MKTNRKTNLKRILAASVFALLIAALAVVYVTFGEKAVSGSKAITITVVNSAAEETAYALKTDALYLRQAMDECEGLTYTGSDGPYGIMIDSVNGERAVYSENGAYWVLYRSVTTVTIANTSPSSWPGSLGFNLTTLSKG